MKLTIEINDAIAKDFKTDKFDDFFSRVIYSMQDENGHYNRLCGLYEKEIAEELQRAFKNAEVLGND